MSRSPNTFTAAAPHSGHTGVGHGQASVVARPFEGSSATTVRRGSLLSSPAVGSSSSPFTRAVPVPLGLATRARRVSVAGDDVELYGGMPPASSTSMASFAAPQRSSPPLTGPPPSRGVVGRPCPANSLPASPAVASSSPIRQRLAASPALASSSPISNGSGLSPAVDIAGGRNGSSGYSSSFMRTSHHDPDRLSASYRSGFISSFPPPPSTPQRSAHESSSPLAWAQTPPSWSLREAEASSPPMRLRSTREQTPPSWSLREEDSSSPPMRSRSTREELLRTTPAPATPPPAHRSYEELRLTTPAPATPPLRSRSFLEDLRYGGTDAVSGVEVTEDPAIHFEQQAPDMYRGIDSRRLGYDSATSRLTTPLAMPQSFAEFPPPVAREGLERPSPVGADLTASPTSASQRRRVIGTSTSSRRSSDILSIGGRAGGRASASASGGDARVGGADRDRAPGSGSSRHNHAGRHREEQHQRRLHRREAQANSVEAALAGIGRLRNRLASDEATPVSLDDGFVEEDDTAINGLTEQERFIMEALACSLEDEGHEEDLMLRLLQGLQPGLQRSSSPPRRPAGLDPTIMSALPIIEWTASRSSGRAEGEPPEECPLCLAEYEVGDKLLMLPCFHQIHEECVSQWLARSTTCPVCKTDVQESITATFED